jgi:hypothetical protein
MPEGLSVSRSGRSTGGTGKAGADHYKSVLEASNQNNKVTQRRSGQQRLSGNCTFKFDIERIGIRHGGTPIQVMMIASDDVEVAMIHQDNSRGAPNTIS